MKPPTSLLLRRLSTRLWRNAFMLVATILLPACLNALTLHPVDAKAEKPARVELLFQVLARNEPVLGLTPENLTVMEGDLPATRGQSWTLFNPDMRSRMQVALLLDLGNSPSASQRAELAVAGQHFIDKVGGLPKTAVYAFDGSPEPHLIVPFDSPPSQAVALVGSLAQFESQDSSTDLYGAYQRVVRDLQQRVDQSGVKLGSVVLVSRGPDRAARVDPSLLRTRRDQEDGIERYVVLVGQSAQKADLDWLGNHPAILVADTGQLTSPLEQIAGQIEARGRSLYLLSLCSAARAGQHELAIDVRRTLTKNNKEEVQEGHLTHTFDAAGFGPGCDPNGVDAAQWRGALHQTPISHAEIPSTGPIQSGKKATPASASSVAVQKPPSPTAKQAGRAKRGPDLRLEPAN